MIFLLQPAADSSVDPEYELRHDDYTRTNIAIQDCRSYGGDFVLNEYGPSIHLDPADPAYRPEDCWVRSLGDYKSLAMAKLAALQHYEKGKK